MDFPFPLNSSVLIERPAVTIPYITIISIMSAIGTFGNILVIIAMAKFLRRNSSVYKGDVFLLNLACSDIIVTALINPFAATGSALGSSLYDGIFPLCLALGSICVISCVVSLLSICCISINRYIFICHNTRYARIYTRRNCTIMCLMTWVVGVLIDLPSQVGLSHHWFDPKSHKCIWNRKNAYGYTVFFSTCGVLVPFCLMVFFYWRIFRHIAQSKKTLNAYSDTSKLASIGKTLRQAKMIFCIFVMFFVCWSPYIAVLLLDIYDSWPLESHLYSSLFAHVHASINFIIYGASNARIRGAYHRILCGHIEDVARSSTQLSGPSWLGKSKKKTNYSDAGTSDTVESSM